MIILKIIICITIICLSSYLGIEKARTFEERVLELQKIKNGLSFFKSKIEFTYEPIKEILEEISNSVYCGEENIFMATAKNLKNLDSSLAWQEAIDKSTKINKDDKEILKQFGKLLGKVDKKGQISEIELALSFTESQIEKAERLKTKNVKLYKSLGTIIGFGIVVLFW